MQEINPPWIQHPEFPPYDCFWRQSGEFWYLDVWLPYWCSLSEEEKKRYVEKWNAPEEWLIFTPLDPERFDYAANVWLEEDNIKETESMPTYKKIFNKLKKYRYHILLILMFAGCSGMYVYYHVSPSTTPKDLLYNNKPIPRLSDQIPNELDLEQASCHNKKLPKNLFYKNKPIPDACMKKLTPRPSDQMPNELDLDTFIPGQDDAEHDIYRWKYIGTLPHGPHLVYAYYSCQSDDCTYTEISIIRRIGNILKIADNGCNSIREEHASTSISEECTLDGDTLTYSQKMPYSLLYDEIIQKYPELEEKLQNKKGTDLSSENAGHVGSGTFEVTITGWGQFSNKRCISFTPAQDNNDFDAQNWLKNTPKASLDLGDATFGVFAVYASQHPHEPLTMEQLKEIVLEAITYTAEQASCHNKILPKNLFYKNKPIPDACMKKLTPRLSDQMPNELDLDTFIPEQDDAEHDIYRWKYIGTLPHGPRLVYAYYSCQSDDHTYTEISIIRRIGNILKIADNGCNSIREEHASTSISEECTLDGDTLTYSQKMPYSLLYDEIIQKYPELEEKLQNKKGTDLSSENAGHVGSGTFEVTITGWGQFSNKRCISFTPAQDNNDFDAQNWLKNTPKASLDLGDATFGVFAVYASQHPHEPLTMEQLKEIVLEAITYTAEEVSYHNKELPKDLLYNNKSIPDKWMNRLTPRISYQLPNELDLDTFVLPWDSAANQDICYWKYIGTLPHGPHLVLANWTPRYGSGSFTEISIIRRIGNTLKIADDSIGTGYHSTCIWDDACTLDGYTLTYVQCMTSYSLLDDVIIPTYPELEKELRNKQWECDLGSLWDRRGTHEIGYGTFEVTVTEQNKFKNKHLISLTPEKSYDGFNAQKWLKNTPKASLGLGDALFGVVDAYASQHAYKPITMEQLKEMVLEALTYAAEKEK
ncbi:MAG: hypothetical protein WC707_06315 [Candidatus Babeliaceae bacterium]|jgi:hypothetical protein